MKRKTFFFLFFFLFLFPALVSAEGRLVNDTYAHLGCKFNDTMESEENWLENGNACWNWNEHHTYDLTRLLGERKNITQANITFKTGLYKGCPGITLVTVSNYGGGLKAIHSEDSIGHTAYYNVSIGDVGEWDYLTISEPNCKVDFTEVWLEFNETKLPDLLLNGSDFNISNTLPFEGDGVEISAVIINNGTANSSGFYVDLLGAGEGGERLLQRKWVDGLEVNESSQINFSWNASRGIRYLVLKADAGEEIDEGDESNNSEMGGVVVGYFEINWFWVGLIVSLAMMLLFMVLLLVFVLRSFRSSGYGSGTTCPRCGHIIRKKARKCPVCGKKL